MYREILSVHWVNYHREAMLMEQWIRQDWDLSQSAPESALQAVSCHQPSLLLRLSSVLTADSVGSSYLFLNWGINCPVFSVGLACIFHAAASSPSAPFYLYPGLPIPHRLHVTVLSYSVDRTPAFEWWASVPFICMELMWDDSHKQPLDWHPRLHKPSLLRRWLAWKPPSPPDLLADLHSGAPCSVYAFPKPWVGGRGWHVALCSRCSSCVHSALHGDPGAGAGAWGAADGRGQPVLGAAPWSGTGLAVGWCPFPFSLPELYPPSARCSCFRRPLKTLCGSLPSESFLTPMLSSYEKRSWPWTTSDSTTCCAGTGKTSTRLSATFTVASP